MFWKSLLILPLLFGALPSTTNYQLNSYGFGSGGTANSTTGNYALEGLSGEVGGQTGTTSTYTLKPGFIETQQANVPKISAFDNGGGRYYNKLHFVIDQQANPSDALYALQISTSSNFSTGVNYVKSDFTIGSSLVVADYQTYSAFGGASGTNVIGLASNTTYYLRAKATQGKFTESGFGPSLSATTVNPSISFTVSPTTVAFGNLLPNTVTDAGSNINLTFDTNANSGGDVYVAGQNGGLLSAATSHTITSATGDLSSLSNGFGAQVTSTRTSFPYNGVLDNFNRSNAADLGSNWTNAGGAFLDFGINSNVAHDAGGNFAFDYWNVQTFGPDAEAYATVKNTSANAIRIEARLDSSTRTAYAVNVVSSTGTWSILRLDPGSNTLGSTFSQAMSADDKIGIRVIGSTIEAWYYNNASSTWSLLASRTDSTYSTANYIGMESFASDLDDFGGGTVPANVLSAVSPYNGAANNVGVTDSTIRKMVTSSSQVFSGSATVLLKSKATGTDSAANDYREVLTMLASASF